MVTRVYGKVNGTDIIFQIQDNNWQVPVPLSKDGAYVVEIIAEDDAGNTSYLARMLFIVTKTIVESYLLSLKYHGKLQDPYNVVVDGGVKVEIGYGSSVVKVDSYLIKASESN